MYCLNQRIGILFRQNLTKKSYQLRYFFIDNDSNMYYISSLPKLQKIIRFSRNLKQIKTRLSKLGQKNLNLNNYTFSQPKPYNPQVVLPLCNRTYIEMKQKQKQSKDSSTSSTQKSTQKTAFMLLGFLDQDTSVLYDQIMHLLGRKKKQQSRRKSLLLQPKQQQQAQSKVFKSYVQCIESFSMKEQKQTENQYQGEMLNGRASGSGKQILISKGITYNGAFYEGKKHGKGYLVNENLDTMQCEFLEDELVGI